MRQRSRHGSGVGLCDARHDDPAMRVDIPSLKRGADRQRAHPMDDQAIGGWQPSNALSGSQRIGHTDLKDFQSRDVRQRGRHARKIMHGNARGLHRSLGDIHSDLPSDWHGNDQGTLGVRREDQAM